jgi:mono/diheme cytochrome c family protein
VPAIRHPVVSNRLPFPFNVRAGMLVWDELYFKPGQYGWNDAKSAEWNRGAFLVRGPGHCGACHTPKTFLGGDKTAEEFRGYKTQGWFAPDILRAGGGGLDGWSVADTVSYLKSGHNRFAAASGPMAEEVAKSSSGMTDGDLQDIAVYLEDPDVKGVDAPRNDRPSAQRADDPMMKAGAAIYSDLCASCHRSDGAGVAFLIPNLAASASVASRDPTTLIRVVLLGANSVATQQEPTAPAMPSFAWQLSDAEIAAVTTYVRNAWNHAAPPVAESDVREARDKLLAARSRP